MISDLRFAIRMLLHSRGFTATALVVLTLGIGATTTMFSATNSVLLRPLPYPDAGRMVAVRTPSAAAAMTSDSSAGRHAKVATGSVGESSSRSLPGGALPYTQTPLV